MTLQIGSGSKIIVSDPQHWFTDRDPPIDSFFLGVSGAGAPWKRKEQPHQSRHDLLQLQVTEIAGFLSAE